MSVLYDDIKMSESIASKNLKAIKRKVLEALMTASEIIDESPYIKIRKGDERTERICLFAIVDMLLTVERNFVEDSKIEVFEQDETPNKLPM